MPGPARLATGDLTGATLRQWAAVSSAVDALADADFARPARLPGWRVAELVAHLGNALDCVVGWSNAPAPDKADLTAAPYLLTLPAAAAVVDAREKAAAVAMTPGELRGAFRRARDSFAELVQTGDPARLIAARAGSIRLDELIVTRCVEGVVHGFDLPQQVTPDREALKITTKALLAALAVAAPGKSVEVRVPPFGAVQAVRGIRHTRGTPPNVVETDAVTWVRLATGRLRWADAIRAAALRASGDRSDISALLPLV